MWYDADIDRLMRRTRSRPVPAGRVTPGEALGFGLTLAVGSVLVMGVLVGPLPALLLAFTIFFYAVVYTMWLKRRTPENIVIGGAAGALPPVIGWAAASGSVSLESLVLFAIIFLWTPPHFWALALLQSGDYQRANVPMLPVVAGERVTRRRILLYSLVLAPLGVVPALTGLATPAYGAVAAALGLVFVWLAVRVLRSDAADRRPPGQLFAFSILYLFLLFAVLLGEHAAAGLGLLA
jgi:protoheme IX farnesyltransferase